MEKKAPPLAFTLSWGLFYVVYNTVKGYYGIPVQTLTYTNVILYTYIAYSVTFCLIAYSFFRSPRHRVLKGILLALYVVDTVLIFIELPDQIGFNPKVWVKTIETWPRDKFLLRIVLDQIKSCFQCGLVGLSFLQLRPFFYDYPEPNPLQKILLRFTGVLWILSTTFELGMVLLWAKILGKF